MAVRGFLATYISYFVIKGGNKDEKIVPNKQIAKTMIIRSILGNINAFCMFSSVLMTDIYIVTIISNTVPIFTIVLSYLFLGEEITFKKVICIFVGIFGIILIVDPGILTFNFNVQESSRGKIIGCMLMTLFAIVSATVKIILKKSRIISWHVQSAPKQSLPGRRQYRFRLYRHSVHRK